MAEASILILSRDPIVARLPARLQAEGMQAYAARSARELGDFLGQTRQCVAVVDRDLPREELFLINELLQQHAIPTLTLVSAETYARLALDPARSTAQEFAPKPSSIEELVLRTKALILRAGYELPALPVDASGFPVSGASAGIGKVIAVFAAKGGVGKSTVAANLAVGLSRFYRYRTLVVDSDLWFGDIGFMFDVTSKKSLFDLCSGEEPDEQALREALVHHPSGVALLMRPPDLVSVDKMDFNAVKQVLMVASRIFDFVVVDMRSSLDEMVLQLLDVADQILLVTTPEVSTIANTSRFLTVAEQLGYDSRISLIVNRANTGLDAKSIRQTLLMDVACTLVSAGQQVVNSANEGVPILVRPSRDSGIAADLVRLVEKVAGRPVPKPAAAAQWLADGKGKERPTGDARARAN